VSCLVVGVGDGLGMAVCRRFGAEGMSVAAVARKADELEARVAALVDDGVDAVAIPDDLADPDAPARIVDAASVNTGPVEVLVYNCAAIGRPGRPTELHPPALARSLQVNVLGALATAQLVARGMRRRARGTIIFTGGAWAVTPSADYAALGLTKAAQRNLALSLAEELAPAGVHVVTVTITGAIEPGTGHTAERLATLYWELHAQPGPGWAPEVIH
jgi:short-subunit dehydrogenase